MRRMARAATQALIDAEPTLTELDTQAGDGDLGTNMARGATAIRELEEAVWHSPHSALKAMGIAVRRAIGGSSGALYAVAFLRASRRLSQHSSATAGDWADALTLAAEAISETGGATTGDRTMLDALVPAGKALSATLSSGQSIQAALTACADAAEDGAKSTSEMRPNLGRASYLGERALGVRDAGAVAVSVWLKAMASEIERASANGQSS
jgi:triose/dihydroxyacetone kinase / FAD-AMP lyase (cyclizing)